MNWVAVACWTLLLLTAFLCDSVTCKGGRGGARGAARGAARGGVRARLKSAPRYGSSGSGLRVAAAAAAGAGAGAAAGLAGRRMMVSGEAILHDGSENDPQRGNGTGDSVYYSYRSWTSGAEPRGSDCGLGSLLSVALGLFQLFPL
ncbi:shadow of prion protein [Tachyglossus aculeatus]|uniref:shadow of prion protein n=1 Tax=Tachyglossus aculeatus TaxID=9261 RepID=UPI0018F3C98A|nr:shadow of prion protein [Tachyglossus aculeatus]